MDDRFPADVGDECPVNRDEYQEQQHGVQQFGDGRRVDEPTAGGQFDEAKEDVEDPDRKQHQDEIRGIRTEVCMPVFDGAMRRLILVSTLVRTFMFADNMSSGPSSDRPTR